jgi:3-oxoacyl-[acyl-carrier-protein] synthase II
VHRRVVITGIGIVGPTGIGKEAFWSGLMEGRSGVGPVTRFDASAYPSRVAAEVLDESYLDLLEPKRARRMPHVTRMAVSAARLALNDAGFERPRYDPTRAGVVLGTTLASLSDIEKQQAILLERGMNRINPFLAIAGTNHSSACEVAAEAKAEGVNLTQSASCASGLCAVGVGGDFIRSNSLDVCIVGGAESPVIPLVFAGMGRAHDLATNNDPPAKASRPFDKDHDGLVVGEGSAFLIIEELRHAVLRNAHIYAEVLGYAVGSEAVDAFSLDLNRHGARVTLMTALKRSRVAPGEIEYVSAHGSSCPAYDRKEARVLKEALGEMAHRIPISSMKSMLGHAFGAAGAFQTAAAVLAMTGGWLPPTINLVEPDPLCDLNHVSNVPRRLQPRRCLVSNFGYGGVNAFLLLGTAESP